MEMQSAVSPQLLNVGRKPVQDLRARFLMGLLGCLLFLSLFIVIQVMLIPTFAD